MIHLAFALRNPWSRRHEIAAEKVITVSTNKTIEVALYKNSCLVEFSFTITGFSQDHVGFSADIGLVGYNVDFTFYDNRHCIERT